MWQVHAESYLFIPIFPIQVKKKFNTHRSKWHRYKCVDMGAGPVTAGNNDRQRKVVQTVVPHAKLHQSTEEARYFQHMLQVRPKTMNRQLMIPIPLTILHFHSHQLPCTIAANFSQDYSIEFESLSLEQNSREDLLMPTFVFNCNALCHDIWCSQTWYMTHIEIECTKKYIYYLDIWVRWKRVWKRKYLTCALLEKMFKLNYS